MTDTDEPTIPPPTEEEVKSLAAARIAKERERLIEQIWGRA
jgi:hypothetical protein